MGDYFIKLLPQYKLNLIFFTVRVKEEKNIVWSEFLLFFLQIASDKSLFACIRFTLFQVHANHSKHHAHNAHKRR